MAVEIVVHVFNRPGSDQYSRLFCLQAASLIQWPPKCLVRLTAVASADDEKTLAMLKRWDDNGLLAGCENGQIGFNVLVLPRYNIFCRAIGRDLACRNLMPETTACWFADSDGLWGDGCLDALQTLANNKSFECGFPAHYRIHKSHELGDQRMAEVPEPPACALIDPDDFIEVKGRPIGGMLILRGDVAREGYLRDSQKWQAPRPNAEKMIYKDDIAFRNEQKSKGRKFVGLNLPNFFRGRHSLDGAGNKVTKATNAEGRLVPIAVPKTF